MNKYQLYNRVLETMNGDEGTFVASARNWIEEAEEANFNNEKAEELFSKAKQYDLLWRKQAINGRISKRRMIACVKEIAEMNLPNPYDPNEPDPEVIHIEAVEQKTEEETKNAETSKESLKAKETKEQTHILGVIPESDRAGIKEELKNEVTEDKKQEGLFHRKRK